MATRPKLKPVRITRADLIEALEDIVKQFDRKRLIVSPDLVEPDVEDAMQPVREARTLLHYIGHRTSR